MREYFMLRTIGGFMQHFEALNMITVADCFIAVKFTQGPTPLVAHKAIKIEAIKVWLSKPAKRDAYFEARLLVQRVSLRIMIINKNYKMNETTEAHLERGADLNEQLFSSFDNKINESLEDQMSLDFQTPDGDYYRLQNRQLICYNQDLPIDYESQMNIEEDKGHPWDRTDLSLRRQFQAWGLIPAGVPSSLALYSTCINTAQIEGAKSSLRGRGGQVHKIRLARATGFQYIVRKPRSAVPREGLLRVSSRTSPCIINEGHYSANAYRRGQQYVRLHRLYIAQLLRRVAVVF